MLSVFYQSNLQATHSCVSSHSKSWILSASPLSHIFTNPASNLSRPLDGFGWTASRGNSGARGHWGPSRPADFWAIFVWKINKRPFLPWPLHAAVPTCLLLLHISYLKGLHNSTKYLTQDHLRCKCILSFEMIIKFHLANKTHRSILKTSSKNPRNILRTSREHLIDPYPQ